MTSLIPGWEEFVEDNLIKSGIFSGLCLLSNQHEVLYAYGCLTSLDKEEIKQFFNTFSGCDSGESHRVFSLRVKLGSQSKTTYRIYHKTQISVYATAPGNHSGLTVSKLPLGIFITLFQKPVIPHKAITQVEFFTAKLRL